MATEEPQFQARSAQVVTPITRGGASRGRGRNSRNHGFATVARGDIIDLISEVTVLEQILIRSLPAGTKAALRARAESHRRSVEAEAREILADALKRDPVTMVDLLSVDEGTDIEFEPQRLGLTDRPPEL